jgi:putative redox protein
MARLDTFNVTLPGGRRVLAEIRGHTIVTDQPVENGGADSAPTPLETFYASIGTCVGITLQGFCAKRDIPFTDIRIAQHMHYADDGHLEAVTLDVQLPPEFPERYREAALRAGETCAVKRAINAGPRFEVRAVQAAARAA